MMSFSYFTGILLSLLLHALVIGLLFFQGVKKPQEIKVRPPVIHANLIAETPTQKKTPQTVKKQQPLKQEQQKKLQEKKSIEKQRLAEKKQAEKKLAEKKAAEKAKQIKIAKKKAEEEAKAKEIKAKAAKLKEEKAKKEKLAKEKAAQQKAEKERLAKEKLKREALAEQQRLAAESELAALVAEEQQAIQLAEDQQQAADIVAVITRYAQGQWNRPPSARNNMQVILQVDMVPTGEVINVSVLESSGDAAFDRSAINAVKKAAPFEELKTVPNRVFENYFRRFKMIFRPEDLRR